jgi:hypothetical protein
MIWRSRRERAGGLDFGVMCYFSSMMCWENSISARVCQEPLGVAETWCVFAK